MTTEQLHQLLLNNLSTAVLLLNSNLQVNYINPAAETLLATSCNRLLGSGMETLLGEETAVLAFREALASGSPFTHRKATLRLPDRTRTTVDYTVTPLQTENRLLLVEIQPMERLLRINREEARISARDTSRNLVRGLAHEIKNPLGGIRGAAQLLAEDLDEESELHEYTDIITFETNRLCNLVDRLLGPTTIPQFDSVNIHEVTEHVATLIEAETRGALIIKRDYDPSIPDLTGDREQLIQAVLNIARNAMQSIQSDDIKYGEITFRSRIQRHFTIGKAHHRVVCRLDIMDNGPGIDTDIVDRIFYPMISGRADGSGLGLTIAQNAINLHRGLIECENIPGQTIFSIYLPLETDYGNPSDCLDS